MKNVNSSSRCTRPKKGGWPAAPLFVLPHGNRFFQRWFFHCGSKRWRLKSTCGLRSWRSRRSLKSSPPLANAKRLLEVYSGLPLKGRGSPDLNGCRFEGKGQEFGGGFLFKTHFWASKSPKPSRTLKESLPPWPRLVSPVPSRRA